MILGIILIILAVFFFVLLTCIGWIIGTFNWFVNAQQNIKTQFSNIKTEYQRRADLFYNLVQSVRAHMKFEKSTLVEVTKMRNVNLNGPKAEVVKKMKDMDALFSKLLVTVEAYPNLKSIRQFTKFSDEVRITEDRINVARTDYNEVVREYNVRVKQFPTSIVARWKNFNIEKYYMNEPKTDYSPKISFEDGEDVMRLGPH
jgi:LemA protein